MLRINSKGKSLKVKSSENLSFNVMSEPKSSDRILLVVAHPDDEWLSCSGYLQRAVLNGAQLKIIVVTLGEWSAAYSYLDSGRLKSFFASLGAKRAKETLSALKLVGGIKENTIFCGFPSGNLHLLFKKNWAEPVFVNYLKSDKVIFDFVKEPGVAFSGKELSRILRHSILDFEPTAIITHGIIDTHKDHRTIYWLVKDYLGELENKIKTYFFLVHYRGFSFSSKNSLNHKLSPPKRFIGSGFLWYSFELNKQEQKIKNKGMLKYKTQLKNPYLNILLRSFCKGNELFYQEKQ
ncbi:MAG: hypothetical protein A2418_02925 [Candidatus Brennerbacteria bacterium RIFOXYC1_FULL_41_11]|nr:MAG: hypothetical protein A2391_00470 [Candidatus Brennerbacteria bacterium RIFOXYB1_FULL_41_13]OGY40452.1 MAG: hypothetical protein A2418_02925 [Candidatus Brennerbacteria bacterium RIFOXYC1_FULL_41_11]